jgi:tRNA pseudouridine38-40 synthase
MGKFYIGHICYNGSKFYGWQKQKDVRTVQQEIYNSIRSLYEFGRIDVKATSRTDRGVHSFGQVVKMLIPRKEEAEFMLKHVNSALPDDMHLSDLTRINPSFRVTHMALDKEYLYFFTPDSSHKNHSFIGHNNSDKELDIELMRKACKLFIGSHDFTHFQYKSEVSGDKVREILSCNIICASEIFPNHFSPDDNVLCLSIRGKGFLKQMVRIIMGSLLYVGIGKGSVEGIEAALKPETTIKPGFIAPGSGLFLYDIRFPTLDKGTLTEIVDSRSYKEKFPQFELWQSEGVNGFGLFEELEGA